MKAYDNLYRLIIDGTIKDGDKLPSENAMAKHWGVSRGTIRMAMKRLEEDGYINKSQGKRATVATYAMHKKKFRKLAVQFMFRRFIKSPLQSFT